MVVERAAMTLLKAKPETKRRIPLGEERWAGSKTKCVLRNINLRMLALQLRGAAGAKLVRNFSSYLLHPDLVVEP